MGSDTGTARPGASGAVANQIQAYAEGRTTGVLHIFHNNDRGKIFLLKGEVVDAVFGGRRGVQAAIDMINLPDPPTAFTLDEGTRFRTIQMSYAELLLDAARYTDGRTPSARKARPTDRMMRQSLPSLKFWLHGQEHVVRLDKPMVRIGRAKDNDLMIEEPSVSREHARVERHDFGVMLHDVGSANGTYLAGHRIKDAVLQAGDEIRLGQVPAKFLVDELVEVTSAKPTMRPPAPSPDAGAERGEINRAETVPLAQSLGLEAIHFPIIPAAPVAEMRRAG